MCGMALKHRCRNSDVRERGGLKEGVMTRVEKGVFVAWLPERTNGNRQTLTSISRTVPARAGPAAARRWQTEVELAILFDSSSELIRTRSPPNPYLPIQRRRS
ncbi:hypothetical protein EVAR_24193_1 [Eumeta japonica]|uniref:Uncharacterized protein n=1 Tax=Eumeta variegata TaxID=151549 RepID=A0A4C1W526_EUMVA|nr:hypothetical protein EVAR_24193_1 [Eumeta japonica]